MLGKGERRGLVMIFGLLLVMGLLVPSIALADIANISGVVSYYGSATGKVRIGAFSDLGQENPSCEWIASMPKWYELYGCPLGELYVCGFMDADGDGNYGEAGEPTGCYDGNGDGKPDTVAVVVNETTGDVDFTLYDPAPEFVPEPGTMLLLGGGLMGLAGYARLRLRRR